MKKGIICLIVLLVLFTPFACSILTTTENHIPREGTWYCEELQIQFSWEKAEDNYAIIDGKKIQTSVGNDKGSPYFSISGQDFENADTLGKDIFYGECVSFDDNVFITKDYDTGKEYVFKRVH